MWCALVEGRPVEGHVSLSKNPAAVPHHKEDARSGHLRHTAIHHPTNICAPALSLTLLRIPTSRGCFAYWRQLLTRFNITIRASCIPKRSSHWAIFQEKGKRVNYSKSLTSHSLVNHLFASSASPKNIIMVKIWWKMHLNRLSLLHLIRYGKNIYLDYLSQRISPCELILWSKDPLNEYEREAFTLFEQMLDRLRELDVHYVIYISIWNM